VPVDWIFDKSSIAFGLYVGNPTDSVDGQIIHGDGSNKILMTAGGQQFKQMVQPAQGKHNMQAVCYTVTANY
jgi:hypothetical protein